MTDVITTDYYAPDAGCHLGCRAQAASITNALGHATQITYYNAHGQPEEIIDSNGRIKTHRIGSDTRRLTYDAASHIINTAETPTPVYNRTYDYDANSNRAKALPKNIQPRQAYR
ncbi:hypothetical protein [Nitrosomonas ureae]|uniref:hypothetical protein n=1 Tax=Nitrosomonas ureae TaxID=44577 RepID=UPI0011B06E2A|nr:hypothetical protein [Nitrosomonas ureae]